MRLRERAALAAVVAAVLVEVVVARDASAQSSPVVPDAVTDLLREYEIRLEAHRRELLDREAALERARREIGALRKRQADQPLAPAPSADAGRILDLERHRKESREEIARLRAEIAALKEQASKPPPATEPSVPHDDARLHELERSEKQSRLEIARLQATNEALEAQLKAVMTAAAERSSQEAEHARAERNAALAVSLQHELDAERENRAVLEHEVERLVLVTRSAEPTVGLTRSLDDARAEILLLNQRLAHEQRARESLEIVVARVRRVAQIGAGDDWVDRFETTMNERRDQAERLQEELHNANESIVSLKAKLEASAGAAPAAPGGVNGIEDEVKKLRDALQTAQHANEDLRSQAELAARLAELLYGQSR